MTSARRHLAGGPAASDDDEKRDGDVATVAG
jgi:hypothetical protein